MTQRHGREPRPATHDVWYFVAIAALSGDDAHHDAAVAALTLAIDDEFVRAATTRAEILVGPSRAGGARMQRAWDFVEGCVMVAGYLTTNRDRAAAPPDVEPVGDYSLSA